MLSSYLCLCVLMLFYHVCVISWPFLRPNAVFLSMVSDWGLSVSECCLLLCVLTSASLRPNAFFQSLRLSVFVRVLIMHH